MIYVIVIILSLYLAVCAFYLVFQERLLFVSLRKKNVDAKIVLGSEFEEIFIDGPEQGRIHILHIKCKNPRGVILYFHGNTGGVDRWGAIAEELTTYGFDVFLPDYRGYGKSRGPRTEELLYQDAALVYQQALEYYTEDRICLYGRSLGSGLVTWLAARTNPAGVVLETPYLSMIDVAEHHLKIIPVRLFLKFKFRSDLVINQIKAPILIAHGTKDKLVPYKSAMALYETIENKDAAKMLTIPGGKHGNLNGYPVMRKSLEYFFDSNFGFRGPR